jgi:hypothetical protein
MRLRGEEQVAEPDYINAAIGGGLTGLLMHRLFGKS